MKTTRILPAILSLILAVSACVNKGEAGSEALETAASKTEEATTAAAAESTDGESEEFPVGKKGEEYILPAAKTHVYTSVELSGLTGEELRLARNEIYARYGRIFKSADLETYFSEKPWYGPSIEPDAFDENVLTQTERDNLKAILNAEKLLASGEITCPKIGREEFPVVDGSTATLPLSQAVYRLATGADEGEAETHIQHNKTTQAYLNLIQNQGVDLVIAYEPGEQVKESLEQNKNSILIKPIGRDALVFMANGKNPVNSLTQRQVLDIYTGNTTNWKELGGRDQLIKAFQRPSSSGSQNLMDKLVMKGQEMVSAPQEYVFSEMEGVIAGLASYDNTGEALGYSVYYYAKNMYERPELKFMGIDGVVPSNDTIRDGSYPYVNNFYAAIRKDEPKDSKAYQLYEWLTSDDGQSLVNTLGYVGIRDIRKTLPGGFEDSQADYPGEIPIEEGEVILGSGEYLYGESGIGVFDRKMRLLKFIEHVHTLNEETFLICSDRSVLPMLDTVSGNSGIYSIAEDRWVCDPVYSSVYPVKDGFELERFTRAQDNYQITYDYANAQGKLVRTGVSQEEHTREAEESGEAGISYAYSIERFAQYYPEILERHHADVGDIEQYGAEDTKFSVTDREGMSHFYDNDGTPLFEFDKTGLKLGENDSIYPSVAGKDLSYLTVNSYNGEKYQYHFYVYRNGVLFKELTAGINEPVDSYIFDIEDKFYTRTVGNYLYVYNYQDELCAKFLKGVIDIRLER